MVPAGHFFSLGILNDEACSVYSSCYGGSTVNSIKKERFECYVKGEVTFIC